MEKVGKGEETLEKSREGVHSPAIWRGDEIFHAKSDVLQILLPHFWQINICIWIAWAALVSTHQSVGSVFTLCMDHRLVQVGMGAAGLAEAHVHNYSTISPTFSVGAMVEEVGVKLAMGSTPHPPKMTAKS
jgi:hypothetical protein